MASPGGLRRRRHNRGEVCPDCEAAGHPHIHDGCLGHAKHTNPERRAAAIEKWGHEGPFPCEAKPRPGLEVCKDHGGKTKQAEAVVAETKAAVKAEKTLRRRLGDNAGAQPVLNPAKELALLAGQMKAWRDEAMAMVAELTDFVITEHGEAATDDEEGDGEAPMPLLVPAKAIEIHPFVALAERAQDRLAKILTDMERIGIAQHHAEIEEAGLLILRETMAGLLAARGVDPTEFMTDLARELRQREAITATIDGDAA